MKFIMLDLANGLFRDIAKKKTKIKSKGIYEKRKTVTFPVYLCIIFLPFRPIFLVV